MSRLLLLVSCLPLGACHDWASLSTSWEGEGVCVAYVVAGTTHTCARMSNGALYCWGDNRFGQLGVGDVAPHRSPVRVSLDELGVSKVYLPSGDGEVSADVGLFTCAIATDNKLRCWGANRSGQLGTGETEARSLPIQVGGLFSEIAKASNGGSHTCAQTADNQLWCWGANANGQLGLGNTTPQSLPARVDTTGFVVDRLTTGTNFTCARGTDGSLWCWGANTSGALGLGDTQQRSAPTRVVSMGTQVARLAAGGAHACAFTNDGTPWCWGDNRFGQLGVGDTMPRLAPTLVGTGMLGVVTQVFTGGSHSCALKTDGTLWCWGDNRSGQLGLGDTDARTLPVQVAPDVLGNQVAAASAGGAHTCAVKSDGSVWCWGNDQYGQVSATAGARLTVPTQLFPACQ
ncbi:MAG: hypothetical protein JNJ54_06280 [Myxococcaceae bacterium]|nr:hypothetical protein [Myxococcaceae bacterium]